MFVETGHESSWPTAAFTDPITPAAIAAARIVPHRFLIFVFFILSPFVTSTMFSFSAH
jgi:hypothetical protein